MKINLIIWTINILLIFGASQVQSQNLAYKGIYIDSFDGIVGNTIKEDSLLHYLQDSAFNSIICYRMSNVISATLSSSKNTTLANFIKKARTQYGIKNVLASSESYTTFNSLIAPYNRSRTDSLERFNYYYLEFEFWNVHSTSPVSAANNGYYCTTYLSPKGYACDTSGAFNYYKKMLKSLDSLANKDGIRSATYVGNPNQGQCKFIATTVDLLLCDNYTTSTSKIYTDVKTLFSYFGSTSKTLQIVPIFASYSPGGTFLGDWLSTAPTGPHSEKSVYANYFLPRFNAETGAWKSKLNLVGYQWYRYSGMPHNGNYSTSTFCNPPSTLSVSSITATSAVLSWSTSSGGLGYLVQFRIVGGTTWSGPLTAAGTSLTLSNLLPATSYEFQVKSSCISSTSSFSSSTVFTTSSSLSCGIPSSLNVTSITDVAATLSWASVSGASSYTLKYRKIGSTTWVSNTTASTSKSITGLAASSIYEFQVKTTCVSGSSSYSTSYLFSTLAPVCNSPSGLLSSAITSNSATLKWTAITGVSGYTIQYRIVGSTSWLSASSTSNSKNILALVENSNYEFQVQTKCTSTNVSSFSASGLFTTLPSGCGIPSNITASAATTNSFTIYWMGTSTASSYKIQYRKSTSTSWTVVTTSNSYKNISSLTTASLYEFQVAAVCASGVSNYSAIETISTLGTTSFCGIASGLFADQISLNSVTLNWIAVNGASSYKVQYRKVGTSSWSNKTTSFTNKNITSLTSNTNYEFQVQTVCSSGTSSFSSSGFFVTTPLVVGASAIADSSNSSLSVMNRSQKIQQTENEKKPLGVFTLFPNPTDPEHINLKVQAGSKEIITIRIYDLTARLVYTKTTLTDDDGFLELKIKTDTELKVGVYLVEGFTTTQKMTCKLAIQ